MSKLAKTTANDATSLVVNPTLASGLVSKVILTIILAIVSIVATVSLAYVGAVSFFHTATGVSSWIIFIILFVVNLKTGSKNKISKEVDNPLSANGLFMRFMLILAGLEFYSTAGITSIALISMITGWIVFKLCSLSASVRKYKEYTSLIAEARKKA